MAFECTFDGDTDIAIMRDGPSTVALVRVGRDPEEAANWFAMVGLDIAVGGGLECFFRLLRVDAVTGEETDYDSGKATAHIIRGNDRKTVLSAALKATRALLSDARPADVYRVTYDVPPPETALEKHHAITDVFHECGYRVTRFDEYRGKRMWRMERDSDTGVDHPMETCLERVVDGGCDEPRGADTRDGRDGGTGSAESEPLAVQS